MDARCLKALFRCAIRQFITKSHKVAIRLRLQSFMFNAPHDTPAQR
ncbi:hypothetical protein GMES_4220 [Paraglaciecola mesophila KMM 241]|uniref:Uncharacterized protein n=1 Tax=Paraglaciecola mesophila KMM 241 TaxID=1128912 RepID=K6Z7Y8_9ALTE|nr:hypothetical protein GMES_4220 [Paraglaciecola mesophila KMM 241]